MNLLAIDTCTELIGLAFTHGKNSAALSVPDSKNRHAELLLPALLVFLEKHTLKLSDFSHLAITVGPGSFTGIRVGLGAAKGIHAASGMELIGITTLELKAWMASRGTGSTIAVLDRFKKNKFLLQIFDAGMNEKTPAQVLEESDISTTLEKEADVVLTGNFAQEFMAKSSKKFQTHALVINSAEAMIHLVQHKLKHNLPFTPAEPFYLMEADAKLPEKAIIDMK